MRLACLTPAIAGLQNSERYRGLIDFDRIGILGLSFGGTAAIHSPGLEFVLHGKEKRLESYPPVKAVVSLLPYLGTRSSDPIGRLENLSAPLMVIAGEQDGIAPWQVVRDKLQI